MTGAVRDLAEGADKVRDELIGPSLGEELRRGALIALAVALGAQLVYLAARFRWVFGTAAVVAVSGLIGFVGIVVPHAIRLLSGGSARLLLPLSFLLGAGFLVAADVVARTALSPAELPIGVVTAFVGAPFFALVLRTARGGAA